MTNYNTIAIDGDGMYTEICDTYDKAVDFALAMIDSDEELASAEEFCDVSNSEIFICEA